MVLKGAIFMEKHDPMDALKQDPQAAALLSDPQALSALLASKEAQTVASLLQKLGGSGLKDAAAAATAGDGAALEQLLSRVAEDPQGKAAISALGKRGAR